MQSASTNTYAILPTGATGPKSQNALLAGTKNGEEEARHHICKVWPSRRGDHKTSGISTPRRDGAAQPAFGGAAASRQQ
eukprot:2300655-Lingulodinium_polyedra.AAC.1